MQKPAPRPRPSPEANLVKVGGRTYRILPGRLITTVQLVFAATATTATEAQDTFEAADDLIVRHYTAYATGGLEAFRVSWTDDQQNNTDFPIPDTNATRIRPVASTLFTNMAAQPLPRWDTVFTKARKRVFVASPVANLSAAATLDISLHYQRLQAV